MVNQGTRVATGMGAKSPSVMLESTVRAPGCPRANPPEWTWLELTLEMLSSTTLAVVVQGRGQLTCIAWDKKKKGKEKGRKQGRLHATSSGTRII